MSRIGEGLRFEGYPLLLKLHWVRDQPGSAAVEAAATSVQDMGAKLGEATTAADGSMRGLGVSWAGPASDAAQRSSAQLTRGAEQTRLLSENGADRILEYGGSFEQMRPKITYEDMSHLNLLDVPAESAKFGVDFWSGAATEDKMSVIARNMDHDAAANDALNTHRTLAQAADDRFMTAGVDPPPSTPVDGGTRTPGPVGGAGSSAPEIGPVDPASAAPAVTASAQPVPQAAVPPAGTGTAAGPGSAALPAAPVGGPAGVVPPGVAAGPGRDGTASGRGGTAQGMGGAAPGAGGTAPGAGRTAPATGGTVRGAGVDAPGGTAPNVGGPAPGVGGTAPRTGGTASGVGGTTGGTRGTGAAPSSLGAADAAGTGASGRLPDPGQARARLGEQFGRDVTAGSPGFRPGTGNGGPGLPGSGGPIGGLAPGVRGGAGTGTGSYGRAGLPPGEAGSRSGGAWRSGLDQNTSRPPGEPGPRAWSRTPGVPVEGVPRPTGEPGVAGRSGAGYGGYAPMMGGVGGARADGDTHRNRYLLPSSEPFDVDLPHAPPVIGPDAEDRG